MTTETADPQTSASDHVASAVAYSINPWLARTYPTALLAACERYWDDWAYTSGKPRPEGLASYAVAAYLMDRDDQSDRFIGYGDDEPTHTARALAMGLMWAGGFLCALVIVGIGFLLSH